MSSPGEPSRTRGCFQTDERWAHPELADYPARPNTITIESASPKQPVRMFKPLSGFGL